MGLPSSDVMGVRELVIVIVFGVLSTIVVAFRFWARHSRKVKLALNDYLSLVALVLSWGISLDCIVGVLLSGSGKEPMDVTLHEFKIQYRIFGGFAELWAAAVTSTKVAVLSFYLSIFRSNETFTRAAYFMMAISVAYGLSVILTGAFICFPNSENYVLEPTGACRNKMLFYIITASINPVIDFTIFLLPIPVLWSLQMNSQRKVELILLFSLGLLTCIISIFKTFAVVDYDPKRSQYTAASDMIWSCLEPDFGVICACLPVMQPVWSSVKSYFSSLASSLATGRSKTKSGSKGSKETLQRSPRVSSHQLRDMQRIRRGHGVGEGIMYPKSTYKIRPTRNRTFDLDLDLESNSNDSLLRDDGSYPDLLGRDVFGVCNSDSVTRFAISYESLSPGRGREYPESEGIMKEVSINVTK